MEKQETKNRDGYNADSVQRAIDSQRRRGHHISKREARMIHALLKGRN